MERKRLRVDLVIVDAEEGERPSHWVAASSLFPHPLRHDSNPPQTSEARDPTAPISESGQRQQNEHICALILRPQQRSAQQLYGRKLTPIEGEIDLGHSSRTFTIFSPSTNYRRDVCSSVSFTHLSVSLHSLWQLPEPPVSPARRCTFYAGFSLFFCVRASPRQHNFTSAVALLRSAALYGELPPADIFNPIVFCTISLALLNCRSAIGEAESALASSPPTNPHYDKHFR